MPMGRRQQGWWAWLVGLVLSLGCMPATGAAETDVRKLTQQAMAAKTPEDALDFLKQAVDLAPDQPVVHLNYASALFKVGQHEIQSENTERGTATFRDAEQELLTVLRLAKNEPDPVERQQLKSQAAFLLGDACFYVFKDKVRAKRYYQDALWYDPTNRGALEARKRFSEE